MQTFNIPKCTFEIGQIVGWVEDPDEHPKLIARGIVIGLVWCPAHWQEHFPAWVLTILVYDLPRSPWMDLPCECEVPEYEVMACNKPIPRWAIDLLDRRLKNEQIAV